VTRGPATVDQVVISDGLKAGERVITEGGDRLTEGGRVQLAGDRPNRQGGAGGGHRRHRREGGGGGPAKGGNGG